MTTHELQFVASMTVCPSDIRKIRKHVELAGASVDPLRNILITPLFVSPDSLVLAREMAEEGRHVLFDSGGYYVQMGKLKYHELYMPLLNAYRANRWAAVYTLPDHVPTSKDDAETVDTKVQQTIQYSSMFFREMPDQLKPRAMPVVQGHTQKQVDACLEAYIRLGVRHIGFGSFGTMGSNSEVNVATHNAVQLAKYVIQVACSYDIKVHLFGLGVPALVAMIRGIGAASFDSSAWLKAAGFGQVFLPFMRAYNISHGNALSELQLGITLKQFEEFQNLTNHRCRYCESPTCLQEHKMHRAAHNLIVIAETVDMVNQGKNSHIRQIYHQGSKKYRGEFEKWLR
jgi:hypothetical protein